MKLSVVIPSFKQTDLTVVHVRECMNSTRIPDEIVVVNDNGDESLFEKIKALPRKCDIIYAYIKEDVGFGYNHACNLGVWLSSGDVLTIEDADHIPTRDAYEKGISLLETRPELGRISYKRRWISLDDVLNKEFEKWEPYGGLGPNAMVAMYRRDVYTFMKGQDERMNEYGWLAYDFKLSERKLNTQISSTHAFLIIKDGSEDNIDKRMSKENRRIYKQNAANEHYNDTNGILNFSYSVERLKQNV